MRPDNLNTKIFLDGADPDQTRDILDRLGFLDGQTTNPSLVAKNPQAQQHVKTDGTFQKEELLGFYKKVIQEISSLIPEGSVSIEVYADSNTTAQAMIDQGTQMFDWIPNAHIKCPTTTAGLEAANRLIAAGKRVNMTLCFTQEQAAAVYTATQGAKPGDVFVSPFIGRLDDRNQRGLDLIANILKMYSPGDGHVEVLAASVRSLDHFLNCLKLNPDIVTVPHNVLVDWADAGMPVPTDPVRVPARLAPIIYQNIALDKPWQDYNIMHDLTDSGMAKFASDWNNLITA
ncbi:transaldolase family protein [Desulfovibrio inopinatus]|uniref:transaldolase family protein n=1 Tax=Desulfovibrio inopinatus TaxID=102109 RepID=UPI0003FB6431|nr:transaldolase family protein [Desulfovibrio inopinatus]